MSTLLTQETGNWKTEERRREKESLVSVMVLEYVINMFVTSQTRTHVVDNVLYRVFCCVKAVVNVTWYIFLRTAYIMFLVLCQYPMIARDSIIARLPSLSSFRKLKLRLLPTTPDYMLLC